MAGTNNTTAVRTTGRRQTRLSRLAVLVIVLILCSLAFLPRGIAAYHRWDLVRWSTTRLQNYVKSHPEDLDAGYRLGLRRAAAGDYPQATEILLDVFQADSSRLDVLNDYAVVLISQRRYREALLALQGLLKASPENARAHANLGRLYLLAHMPFTATRELQRAVQLDPRDLTALRDLGVAHQTTLNYRGAVQDYQAAIRSYPGDVRAHIGLAQSAEQLGEFSLAETALTAVLKAHPRNPEALSTLGDVRLKEAVTDAQVAGAVTILHQAAKANPGDAEVLYNLGMGLRRLNRNAEAVTALMQSLRSSPGYLPAMYQLSQALIGAGRTAEGKRVGEFFALESIRSRLRDSLLDWVHAHPQDRAARLRLARLYLADGNNNLALVECGNILAVDPGNREARRLRVKAALALLTGGAFNNPMPS